MLGFSPLAAAPLAAAGARSYRLVAGQTTFTVTGVSANTIAARRVVADLGAYSYTGNDANVLYIKYTFVAEAGELLWSGKSANLFKSSFIYEDSEWIYVPWEQLSIAVPGEFRSSIPFVITVPWQVDTLLIPSEYRIVTIESNWTIEKLDENRVEKAEPRLRVTN